MKKNTVKILLVLLIAFMILGISNVILATDLVGTVTPNTGSNTAQTVGSVGGIVVGILQVIGVAVAIIMLVMLGIKYVSAAPAEKADIKKSAAMYVVGAVLLLGASLILGWVAGFISDLESETGTGTGRSNIETSYKVA